MALQLLNMYEPQSEGQVAMGVGVFGGGGEFIWDYYWAVSGGYNELIGKFKSDLIVIRGRFQ